MKRTFSVILLTLVISLSSVLLVACNSGGVKSEEDWNRAIDLKTCDAVTINYEKTEYTNLHIKEEITNFTVTYDGVNGILSAVQIVKNYNVSVLDKTTQHHTYAVVDGANIKYYTKDFVENNYVNWNATVIYCDNNEDALLKLNELFVKYLTDFGMDNLNYTEYTLKINKFEKSEAVKQNNTLQQVTFSNGKLSKIYFESKPQKGSQSIDYMKITITVEYYVELTTPNGLDNAIWA